MARMYSFGRGLGAAMRAVKLKKVLEWGPGRSTVQILADKNVESLLCFEHNPNWYEKYKSISIDTRVALCFQQDLDLYVKTPSGLFDLIFIDGRKREECLTRSLLLAQPEGIVIIHDAERVRYHPFIQQWPNYTWSPEKEVAVMSYSIETIRRWREEYGC